MRALHALLTFGALFSFAVPAVAQRQPIDAQRFKPAVTFDGWVTAEGSAVRPTVDPLELGLFLNYGYRPLVIAEDSDVVHAYVSGSLGIDLLASLTLAGPFAVGLGLPLYMAQTGEDNVGGGDDPSFAGLGDLRVVPKLRLLDDRDGFGLALALELRAPTHTGDFNGGARNLQGIPKLIVDHRSAGGLRVGANLGVAIREDTRFFNVRAGDEFTYAVALGYRFGGMLGNTEVGGELAGGVGLGEQDREELPLEGFLFLRHNPSTEWEIIGGPGVGMIPGYGVPTFRVFVGVRYRPTVTDTDGDGIPDAEDTCPNEAGRSTGDPRTHGCPDRDDDGIIDSEDKCPDDPGTKQHDGCPEPERRRVIYKDGQLEILDSVNFEHNSTELRPESRGLLDQVAQTLRENPEIKKVRVEGHTDDTGPRDVNLRLSRARANAVRTYLINKGVNSDRLSAEGYGPDKPIQEGTTDEARKSNRRVEFIVE
jgi:OmpA-OmpF porin, OOP family